jgi:hypothetical protein
MSYDLNNLSDCNLAISIIRENIRLFKQHIEPWKKKYKDVEMPEKIKKFINKYNKKIEIEQEQLYYFQDCKIKLIEENNKINDEQNNSIYIKLSYFQDCKKIIEQITKNIPDQCNKRRKIEQCNII